MHTIPSTQLFRRRPDLWLASVIFVVTVVVFSPVVGHDFINYDDDVFVYANPVIQGGLTLRGIWWAFTTAHEVNWIPLSWISHMLDVQLFGMNPAGHHVVNVLFHAASSSLLFLVLKRSTGARWGSAFVAALFALHPLHVESVAWVAERKDVLSTFFGLLTLYAYTIYSENQKPVWYGVTLFLFLLCLLSKPMLVTMPVVFLLLDWWPLGRFQTPPAAVSGRAVIAINRLLLEKVPFVILSACSSVITYRAQQIEGELFQGYSLMSRIGKSCIAYVSYLYKLVWPVDLAVLYPFPKYPPSSSRILASAALLMAVSGIVIWFGRRYPYLLTGWFWYLITLLPVIGLIQIGQHSIADRYTYVPHIGLYIMIAWGLPQLLERWEWRKMFLVPAAIVTLAVLVVVTSVQLRNWKDAFTLFSHTVSVTNDNWVVLNNLGLLYLNGGMYEEAIKYFKQSLLAKPSYSLAHQNLGVAYTTIQEFDAAVESFNWAHKFDPNNPQVHYALGQIYLMRGDKERALENYRVLDAIGSPFAPKLYEMIVNSSPDIKRQGR